MSNHDPYAPSAAAAPPDGLSEDAPEALEESDQTYTPPEDVTPANADDAPAPAETPAEDGAAGDDAPPAVEAETGVQVPEGTAKEVLEWVGDDKDRAQAALAVEQASDEPRKGLSKDLEELIGE